MSQPRDDTIWLPMDEDVNQYGLDPNSLDYKLRNLRIDRTKRTVGTD